MEEFNLLTFVLSMLSAVVIGIPSFIIGIKAISILVPNWALEDCFKRDRVTNSGVVVSAFIIALAILISYAIF